VKPIGCDASVETLMHQAPMTAGEYMDACIKQIDGFFGEGHAKANPVLLAAMIQASAQDFHTACMCQVISVLADGLNEIASAQDLPRPKRIQA
jgi:hypothetical protein